MGLCDPDEDGDGVPAHDTAAGKGRARRGTGKNSTGLQRGRGTSGVRKQRTHSSSARSEDGSDSEDDRPLLNTAPTRRSGQTLHKSPGPSGPTPAFAATPSPSAPSSPDLSRTLGAIATPVTADTPSVESLHPGAHVALQSLSPRSVSTPVALSPTRWNGCSNANPLPGPSAPRSPSIATSSGTAPRSASPTRALPPYATAGHACPTVPTDSAHRPTAPHASPRLAWTVPDGMADVSELPGYLPAVATGPAHVATPAPPSPDGGDPGTAAPPVDSFSWEHQFTELANPSPSAAIYSQAEMEALTAILNGFPASHASSAALEPLSDFDFGPYLDFGDNHASPSDGSLLFPVTQEDSHHVPANVHHSPRASTLPGTSGSAWTFSSQSSPSPSYHRSPSSTSSLLNVESNVGSAQYKGKSRETALPRRPAPPPVAIDSRSDSPPSSPSNISPRPRTFAIPVCGTVTQRIETIYTASSPPTTTASPSIPDLSPHTALDGGSPLDDPQSPPAKRQRRNDARPKAAAQLKRQFAGSNSLGARSTQPSPSASASNINAPTRVRRPGRNPGAPGLPSLGALPGPLRVKKRGAH